MRIRGDRRSPIARTVRALLMLAAGACGAMALLACSAPPEPPAVSQQFPCDVERVLATKCRVCHGAPVQNGAPFSLTTYAVTRGSFEGEPIWQVMGEVVDAGFMPVAPVSLSPGDGDIIIGWSQDGGPARPEGESCN